MYLNITALENQNIISKEKGGSTGYFACLLCVEVFVCVEACCVWVLECVSLNLTTIIDGIMNTDLWKFILNYSWHAVDLLSPKPTCCCVGYLLLMDILLYL